MLTGRVVRLGEEKGTGPAAILKRLIARSGEPIIRQALRQAMRILGDNFVLGRTIEEALEPGRATTRRRATASPSTCWASAPRRPPTPSAISTATWRRSRRSAKRAGPAPADGASADGAAQRVGEALGHPSALRSGQGGAARRRAAAAPRRAGGRRAAARARAHHRRGGAGPARPDARPVRRRVPRSRARGLAGPRPRGAGLRQARAAGAALARSAGRGRGPGASPCGSSRAPTGTARSSGRRSAGSPTIPCSRARRTRTCRISPAMRFMLANPSAPSSRSSPPTTRTRLPPCYVAAGDAPFEFQRLHGMGEALYDEVVGEGKLRRWPACRIYAPVGPHEDLVAYLVRRLLENGANTSFVNRLADEAAPLEEIIRDPVESGGAGAAAARCGGCRGRPTSTCPSAATAQGWRSASRRCVRRCWRRSRPSWRGRSRPCPIVDAAWSGAGGAAEPVLSPHDRRQQVGTVRTADGRRCRGGAREPRKAAADAWDRAGRAGARRDPGQGRRSLRARPRAADGCHGARGRQDARQCAGRRARGGRLPALLRERGAAAVRRRRSRCRARRGRPTRWRCGARGPFAAISPWNFPLAIFTGQVAAALAAGNPVLAKPAEQTPIVAWLAVQAAARGGRAAGRAASPARRRRGRRRARQGRARGRRRLHRLQRDGLGDQPGAGGAAGRHRALHRGDRRHERHDRRLERAARAGDPRRGALGLRLGGPALLGGAPVLRAGGRGARA